MATDERVIESRREKWRYRCPNGHAGWEATANRFFCYECAYRNWPDNGSFSALIDGVTGERVPRDRFRFRGEFSALQK